jgi:hypothetical protein
MEQKDIIEGDRLIRKFMDHGHMAVRLPYHCSWNDLMPVVEKIESMKAASVYIQNDACWINPGLWRPKFHISVLSDNGKIDAVYQAVIQFIKFYNTNKPHL